MAGKKKIDEVELFCNLLDVIRKQNTIIDYLYCMAVQYEAIDEETDMTRMLRMSLMLLASQKTRRGYRPLIKAERGRRCLNQ